MTLIIVLNAVFAAFVVIGIVGLHLYAIARDHSEQGRLAVAADRPAVEPARRAGGERRRVARPAVGAIRVRGEAASSRALS